MTDIVDTSTTAEQLVARQAAEIAELRAELAELRSMVAPVPVAHEQRTSSRRGVLRLAGAAVAGAAASAVAARPVAAANGDPLTIGESNSATAGTTLVSNNSGLTMVVLNSNAAGSGLQAIGGPYAIEGRSSAGLGVSGFSSSGTAIRAESTTGTGILATAGGTAVRAEGAIGVLGIGAAIGVSGAGGTGTGVFGEGTRYGVFSNGPFGLGPYPSLPTVGAFRVADQILVGDTIYVCVSAAPSLRWRKVAAPAIAGGFHAITPYRAWDTRRGPGAPALTVGSNRVMDVDTSINPSTGLPTAVVLPASATAVAYNITAVAPTGASGFLSVVPGDAASFSVASVNWSSVGQTIGNASTVAIADGRVRVFSGGAAGQVDVVIDVVGYYA